jgi:hypothetical protein
MEIWDNWKKLDPFDFYTNCTIIYSFHCDFYSSVDFNNYILGFIEVEDFSFAHNFTFPILFGLEMTQE